MHFHKIMTMTLCFQTKLWIQMLVFNFIYNHRLCVHTLNCKVHVSFLESDNKTVLPRQYLPVGTSWSPWYSRRLSVATRSSPGRRPRGVSSYSRPCSCRLGSTPPCGPSKTSACGHHWRHNVCNVTISKTNK